MLIAGKRRRELYGAEHETTNNRMEMTAVIEALQALRGRRNVTLYTDSRYIVDGIESWLDNWKRRGWKTAAKKPVKNMDLWQRLDDSRNEHDIEWRWVKGHDGNPGNEKADELANRAIDEMLETLE